MIASVETTASLRLPSCSVASEAELPPDGLHSKLEELGRHGFDGRVDLRSEDWLGELLLRDGQPLAAALAGHGLGQPLRGEQALAALFEHVAAAWSLSLGALDKPLTAALAGIGSEPQEQHASSTEDLRGLLRGLAESGQDGVLELVAAQSWGRVLVAEGQLLGAYTSDEPALVNSLAPLGSVLLGPSPEIRWYPAVAGRVLEMPIVSADLEAGAVEVERQVVWIMSRFEAAWGRARERGRSVDDLEAALCHMLGSLQALATVLESTAGEARALEAALAQPITDSIPRDQLSGLDERLEKLGPRESCPILVELVAEALGRIVQGCPDAHLADYCRQVAGTLDVELRAATGQDTKPADGEGGAGT